MGMTHIRSYSLRIAVIAALGGVALAACSSTDVEPVPVAGEYVLDAFNGAAMKAHPDANTVIDTGYAKLHLVGGGYEIYVRRFVNGVPQNYINETGNWTTTDRTVQFSGGPVSDNVAVSADGKFTVNVLVGSNQSLSFHRVGDLP